MFLQQDELQDLMTRKEELCDELQMYLSKHKTAGFEMLQHPLVFSVPHSSMMNAFLNRQFIEKKKYAEQKLQEKEYAGYVFLHEKPYRFDAFIEVMDKLTDAEYWKLLGEVWINSENIWQNLAQWKRLLKSNRPEKDKFMDADDLKVYNELPDIVTAYRGYTVGKNMYGVSFSLSKEKAEWFASRWSKKGKVLTMKVPKKKVFAYTNGRGEQEIIIV